MRGLGFSLILVMLLLITWSSHAATEVTVDWSSGEVQVQKDAPEDVRDGPSEQVALDPACKKENIRLRAIIKTQQAIIMKQQQKLKEQQATIRQKDDVIRGLDLLRRQGR